MLFILEVSVRAISRINSMLKYTNVGNCHASKAKSGPFDCVFHTEYNDAICMVISGTLLESSNFFHPPGQHMTNYGRAEPANDFRAHA